MIDYFKDFEEIKGYFEDELSKKIFDYKINDLIRDSKDELVDYLYEIYPTSKISRFDAYYKRMGNKEIIIFGANSIGEREYKTLVHAGYKVKAFVDNNEELHGKELKGCPILSLSECVIKYSDCIVIVANEYEGNDYYSQLVSVGYPCENVFKVNKKLRTEFGDIYFDLPELSERICEEGEVFIDAGAFDGNSSLGFIEWCKNNGATVEKIHLFEPMKDGILISKSKLEKLPVEYYQCGLGKEKTELFFEKKAYNLLGSRVQETGTEKIDIDTIDNILKGDKVTFIKMDIEGSEADALIGGMEAIKKHKPKLAISMYHKRRDILELPKLIKQINPEYKLYLRHYSNLKWDFVMYAI